MIAKSRIAQQEINRGLTNLGAIHHQAEMIRRGVLAACLQTVIHRLVQTRWIALDYMRRPD
ncbi:hypothetical protein [Nitrosovibrio sp. Nv4]|uniref:hypothetical protein n=1 Tax=Nitrosovibrio sp. Nv4 TaxID=1945880 RepID=UPI00135CA96A|nr:hypothetical protein [Nitrosovibrio sp. Nv4]